MGLIEQIIIKGGNITGAPYAVRIADAKDVVIEGLECQGKITITHSNNIVLKNCKIKGGVDTDDTSSVSLVKCETFINVEENDEVIMEQPSPTLSSETEEPNFGMLQEFFKDAETCQTFSDDEVTLDLYSPTISSIMGSPNTDMLEAFFNLDFQDNSTCASLQSRSASADSAFTFDFGMLERPASASSSASQGSGPRSAVSAHTV
jgi:hypothetical protein